MGGGYPEGGYAPMSGRVDLGTWLGQAWALFSAQAGIWMGTFLLYLLLALVLWLLWAIPTGQVETMEQTYLAIIHQTLPPAHPQNPFVEFAQSRALGLIIAGVNAVFIGGLYKMALRQARGETISLLGLFSGFPQALPLLLVGIMVSGVVSLLEGLCVWLLHRVGVAPSGAVSGGSLIGLLPALIGEGLLMFAPLLVVDQGASAVEAILGSLDLLRGQWLMAILAYFVLGLIGGVGALVCGVGILASYPLFLISVAVGYLQFTQPPPSAPFPQYLPPQAGVWPPPPAA